MVTTINSQVHLAKNFYDAGNLQRAKEICQEVLQKQPNHLGAFLQLFTVHIEKGEFQAAHDLCLKRLEQNPECPDAHIYRLMAFIHLCYSDPNIDNKSTRKELRRKSQNYMREIRTRLSNHPLTLRQAEIIYSEYFLGSKHTLKLIKQERRAKKLDTHFLDNCESRNHIRNKSLLAAKRALKKKLEREPLNAYALHQYAKINLFSGQLLSAIKYARQAQTLDPKNAKANQEIIIFALISLCPLLWPGHIVISLTLIISSQFNDIFADILKIFGIFIILMIYFYLLLFLDPMLKQLISNTDIRIVADLALIFIIYKWADYLMFFFGNISRRLGKKRVSIKLSPEY